MSTVKTKINAQVVTDFLKQHYNLNDVELETIADGEMSQAYYFEMHGQQKVLRINASTDEGFRKELYAKKHFASKQLLIPAIDEVGQLDNGMYFAVSERSVGKTLYAFSTSELISLMPEIIATAEAIHAIEPPGTGYGWFKLDGNAPCKSWHEALDVVQASEDDVRLPDISFFEMDYYKNLQAKIKDLYKYVPKDIHQLVHGDYGFSNTLSDGKIITGVIDWHDGRYGDPVWDVAWLDFWDSKTGFATAFRQHYADQDRLPDNFDERIKCYKLISGSTGLAFFAKSDQKDKYDYAKQIIASIEE